MHKNITETSVTYDLTAEDVANLRRNAVASHWLLIAEDSGDGKKLVMQTGGRIKDGTVRVFEWAAELSGVKVQKGKSE